MRGSLGKKAERPGLAGRTALAGLGERSSWGWLTLCPLARPIVGSLSTNSKGVAKGATCCLRIGHFE
jgi:hypothetical protein